MSNNIGRLLQCGWMPHTAIGDPDVWHRRENNQIADHLVNHTMSGRESWRHICHKNLEMAEQGNLICHSDGGRRTESCAGAAWLIESCVVNNGTPAHQLVAMRGIFIASSVSSILAESLALDDALSYVCDTVLGLPTKLK